MGQIIGTLRRTEGMLRRRLKMRTRIPQRGGPMMRDIMMSSMRDAMSSRTIPRDAMSSKTITRDVVVMIIRIIIITDRVVAIIRTITGGVEIMRGEIMHPIGISITEEMIIDTDRIITIGGMSILKIIIDGIIIREAAMRGGNGINVIGIHKSQTEATHMPITLLGGKERAHDRDVEGVEEDGMSRKKWRQKELRKQKVAKHLPKSVNYWDYGTPWIQFRERMRLTHF